MAQELRDSLVLGCYTEIGLVEGPQGLRRNEGSGCQSKEE